MHKANHIVGVNCPKCGRQECSVDYTRRRRGGKIVRRRECQKCKKRFMTWERAIGARLEQ